MANAVALAGEAPAAPAMVQKADLNRYRKWFNAYESNKDEELAERLVARRYYHDKQWDEEQLKILRGRKQPPIFDNRIKRKIDFLRGVEQRMRRDPKGYPRGPNDDGAANVATAGMRYACDMNRWEAIASDGTTDGLIDGIGVCFVGLKVGRSGLDPEIKYFDADRFFYDPRSKKPDFSDARFMGNHLWLDIDEAAEKWPHKAADLEKLVDRTAAGMAMTWMEQNDTVAWSDFESRRVRVVEIYEKTPQGWYYCAFTGDTELEYFPSPYLDEDGNPDNPLVAWSPYVDEKGNRYGPIRSMKPMQDEINHRRSKFVHLLNSKQIFTRKGDLDDVDETRRQLHRADGVIEHNGEWGETTGIVDHSQDLAAQAELLAQSQSALENLGPNPGLIGKGGGVADQSGRAILAQRDSGMTELSPVFERNRDWKLRVYRKIWSRIKQAWTGEKWIRITDDDRAPEFLGINRYELDPATGELIATNIISMIDVDIIMDEGPDTVTMNEELLQTLQGNPAVPPKVLIELSSAPNKEKLFELIDQATAPNPQVAEMQARMAKLEEMMAAANIDKSVAETEAKRADTLAKLTTAFTPKQAPTDEFGNPTGPPPGPPDLNAAFAAMQVFPLQYGEPTLEQRSQAAPLPGMSEGEQPPQGAPPPAANGIGMPPPGLPAGGLPIDPQLAGM